MLTPIDIKKRVFKTGLGYDKKEIDAFMHELQDSYETVYKERMELADRVELLGQGMSHYKSIENAIQKALVLAEQTSESTRAAAEKNARHIENEAITKSQIILADAKNQLERVHAKTIALVAEYEKYRAQIKGLALAQSELLDSDSYSINLSMLEAFFSPDTDSSMPVRDSVAAENAKQASAAKRSTASTSKPKKAEKTVSSDTSDVKQFTIDDKEIDFYELPEGQ
jgi:cell division initiation protein